MGSNYNGKYDIDIVMCMDATASMIPLINQVKNNALNFYGDLTRAMAEKGKHANSVRVRIIAFRDYLADKEKAMFATSFLELPQEEERFRSFMADVTPEGGGDDPEDGLEALAYAIKSKWNTSPGKKRHIIVLWTDDAAHPLGFGKDAPNYPAKMAKDFGELSQWWGVGHTESAVMDPQAKRLLIYAPPKEPWPTIASAWDNVILFPSAAGKGLSDTNYRAILDAITNSI